MKTIEELEKELELANAKWRKILYIQNEVANKAISEFQICEITIEELIVKLQEVENIDRDAYVRVRDLEIELYKLKNNLK